MDFFEQIAREQVRAMILNNARREDLSQVFSQGEMRLLGCLHAGADGRTAYDAAVVCLAEVYRRMGEDDTRELLRLSDRAGEIAQQIYEERKGDVPCG